MLPDLLNLDPDKAQGAEWMFSHYQDHLDIRAAIQTQKHLNVQMLEIDTIDWQDFQSWLERHQLLHNDFNAILHLNGNDLTAVDFRNPAQRQTWLWLNFREHQDARGALAI